MLEQVIRLTNRTEIKAFVGAFKELARERPKRIEDVLYIQQMMQRGEQIPDELLENLKNSQQHCELYLDIPGGFGRQFSMLMDYGNLSPNDSKNRFYISVTETFNLVRGNPQRISDEDADSLMGWFFEEWEEITPKPGMMDEFSQFKFSRQFIGEEDVTE